MTSKLTLSSIGLVLAFLGAVSLAEVLGRIYSQHGGPGLATAALVLFAIVVMVHSIRGLCRR